MNYNGDCNDRNLMKRQQREKSQDYKKRAVTVEGQSQLKVST